MGSYREVKSLSEVNPLVDGDFTYNHSMYLSDFHMKVFFERLFGVTFRKAYTKVAAQGDGPDARTADLSLKLNGDNVILFKMNDEAIELLTSDYAILTLHKPPLPATSVAALKQTVSTLNDSYVVTLTKLDQKNKAGVFVSRTRVEELLPKLNARGLYSEYGHPMKFPAMGNEEWMRRMMTIELDHTCCRLSQFRIEQIDGEWALTAVATPAGYFRDAFMAMMEQKPTQGRWSLRCISADTFIDNIMHRELRDIITFDFIDNN
jgi:hypothetical protein